jgi:hypothetical protein
MDLRDLLITMHHRKIHRRTPKQDFKMVLDAAPIAVIPASSLWCLGGLAVGDRVWEGAEESDGCVGVGV